MSKLDEDESEYHHLRDVADSMNRYSEILAKRIRKKERDFGYLLPKYRKMVPDFKMKMKICENLIKENQKFLSAVSENALEHFRLDLKEQFCGKKVFEEKRKKEQSLLKTEKILSTLKQCCRDWSEEGAFERRQSYGVVLDELEHLYPDISKRTKIKVLNPGCGLARLTWEIAKRGFASQGNEFSYFMLFTSHYILNRANKNSETVYPFVHVTKNNYSFRDQSRSVNFPDVDTSELPTEGNFSMVAGDFLEVYGNIEEMGKWDVVVSAFFLDTARNPLQYLETISRLLRVGGYFINFGPLLYHYADNPNEFSIELSLEQLRANLRDFGLELIKEESNLESEYCANVKSMQKTVYNSFLWVCKKFEADEKQAIFDGEKSRLGGLRKVPDYYNSKIYIFRIYILKVSSHIFQLFQCISHAGDSYCERQNKQI
ncbi:hypothetical protein MHBO_000035 [Bonamia ostreae]|uniref:carnosine N-methyltransferase n=1 Tax=Bonamia ostreae TaxID=126728 RepID=A0ABV2AE82_9EUKA